MKTLTEKELIEKKGYYEALILWASGLTLSGTVVLFFDLLDSNLSLWSLIFIAALSLLAWDLRLYRNILNSIPAEKDKSLFRALRDGLFGSKNNTDKSV